MVVAVANRASPCQDLAELIQQSQSTVFFGGAGVSTESGIPDFRSEAGLYAAQEVYGYRPEELLSHHLFVQQPALFFSYYKDNLVAVDAKPNRAHIALGQLEAISLCQAVITQNIDGLHQQAGSQKVIELHGSNWRQYCLECQTKYDLAFILDRANCRNDGVPICQKCQGIVRPDVVLYEEALDQTVIEAAVDAIETAELMIVAGTSLAVYPAAGLLEYFRGSNLVLINLSKTAKDSSAQLVINDAVGQVMTEVRQLIGT